MRSRLPRVRFGTRELSGYDDELSSDDDDSKIAKLTLERTRMIPANNAKKANAAETSAESTPFAACSAILFPHTNFTCLRRLKMSVVAIAPAAAVKGDSP